MTREPHADHHTAPVPDDRRPSDPGGHDLTGKTVVVTGGASGIGLATSILAAQNGARVVAADFDGARLDELATAGRRQGLAIEVIECNVVVERDVQAAFRMATSGGSPVAGVVNCAGITRDCELESMTQEIWDDVISTNLTGSFLVVKEATAAMKGEGGSIVLIGSGAMNTPQPGLAHYIASKMGVVGLGRAVAREFGGSGIRVNIVNPGAVDTPLLRARMGPEEFRRRASTALLGRLGRPEDIAQLVSFLLSDQSEWITGQTFDVNGGSAMR